MSDSAGNCSARDGTAHAAQAAEHGYLRSGIVAVAVLPQSAVRSRRSAREQHLKVCERRPRNHASGGGRGDDNRATRDVAAAEPLAHGESKGQHDCGDGTRLQARFSALRLRISRRASS